MPALTELTTFWESIENEWEALNRQLVAGDWDLVVRRVDDALLRSTMGMSTTRAQHLRRAWNALRESRIGMAQR